MAQSSSTSRAVPVMRSAVHVQRRIRRAGRFPVSGRGTDVPAATGTAGTGAGTGTGPAGLAAADRRPLSAVTAPSADTR